MTHGDGRGFFRAAAVVVFHADVLAQPKVPEFAAPVLRDQDVASRKVPVQQEVRLEERHCVRDVARKPDHLVDGRRAITLRLEQGLEAAEGAELEHQHGRVAFRGFDAAQHGHDVWVGPELHLRVKKLTKWRGIFLDFVKLVSTPMHVPA